MLATVRLVVLTALRNRLFAGLLFALVGATSLSVFLGGTALLEQEQAVVVFAAGAGRVVLVVGLVVFVAFHVQSMIETREVEGILARALARSAFVVGYWSGFALVTCAFVGGLAAALWTVAPSANGIVIWSFSLLLECWIVVAVAIFSGLMLERATSCVIFTLGFYALARLMGLFLGIRDFMADARDIKASDYVVDALALIMPRLDLFAQTGWLVYGQNGELLFPFVQGIVFLALVLAASVFDLSRRQF
ncbi:MAG: hypothetical protein IT566_16860 [Rhodospirillaceae bacterium]|nr:hypothetical protein [Rhodospirillaceae bacterium]